MNPQLILFRESPWQHDWIVTLLRREPLLLVDATNYRHVDPAAIRLAEGECEVILGAKGSVVVEASQVWYLGTPGVTHTLGMGPEAESFATAEWHAFFLSSLSLLPRTVLGLPPFVPIEMSLFSKAHAIRFLRPLGWEFLPVNVEWSEGHQTCPLSAQPEAAEEFLVVFTRKRWVVCHAPAIVFECSSLRELLWRTWDMLLKRNRIWTTLRFRMIDDVPVALCLEDTLPRYTSSQVRTMLIHDALY